MRRLSLLMTVCFLLIILMGCGKTPAVGSTDISAETSTEELTTEEVTEEPTEAPTVAPAESAPPLSELSAELKAEIEAAWQKQFEKALVWSEIIDDYEDGTVRYYGTHQGFPVFFQCIPTTTQNSGRITIGDVKMDWGYNFQIYVYKDGVFYTWLQSLQEKLLTIEDYKGIAAVHYYFFEAKYIK